MKNIAFRCTGAERARSCRSHVVRLCVTGTVAVFLTAGLTGCATVGDATDVVASKTRAVVSAVKRGAKKTISRVRKTASPAPKRSGDGSFELTGILAVVDVDECSAGVDCGPRYQLYNGDFTVRTALVGELHDVHDGLLVTVQGAWDSVQNAPLKGPGWRRTDEAIRVADYEIHTGVRIRGFLSRNAAQYTQSKFGCTVQWPQAYAWRIINREPFLIVRLSSPKVSVTGAEFVELWYHGDTGNFLRENLSHANLKPCS